ncbi:MAG TPA: alpha/beta hydrolase [Rhodanobacter sp.]
MATAGNWVSTSIPTQFANVGNRRIAYRSLGTGPALILCTRFRGTLDTWDPAFLDSLAERFRVITFDYQGIGQSTGTPSYDPKSLAHDVVALADALDENKFVIGGWSLGGQAAQVVATVWPERVTHVILLGTTPPGDSAHASTPAFSAYALKLYNNLDEETILFFEPMSAESREAARTSRLRMGLRTTGRSPDVPEGLYLRLLKESLHDEVFHDDGGYRSFLERTKIPILVISGDHDIGFPVENWFNLSRKWRSLYLSVLPRAGNAVQHQYPELAAHVMGCFVESISSHP